MDNVIAHHWNFSCCLCYASTYPLPCKSKFLSLNVHWPQEYRVCAKEENLACAEKFAGRSNKEQIYIQKYLNGNTNKKKIIKAHTSSFLLFITLFINKYTESLGTAYLFFSYHTILMHEMKPKYNYRNIIRWENKFIKFLTNCSEHIENVSQFFVKKCALLG